MSTDSREVPGRYILERPSDGCTVAGSGDWESIVSEGQRRADDDEQVYWLRDRWAALGPNGRQFDSEGGRVVRIIWPKQAEGLHDRIDDMLR